jgi:hypothetical protein
MFSSCVIVNREVYSVDVETTDKSMVAELPGSLGSIARLCGFAVAIRVAEMYGGIRHVKGLGLILDGKEHPLIEAIGRDAATTIAREFRGEHLEIPRCRAHWLTIRNSAIRADRAAGATRPELARKYALTERHILNILSDQPEDNRQVSLGFE